MKLHLDSSKSEEKSTSIQAPPPNKGFNIALCNFNLVFSIQSFSKKMEVIQMIVIIHDIW